MLEMLILKTMIYKNFNLLSFEFKEYLCDVLREKADISTDICAPIVEMFSAIDKHISVQDFYDLLAEADSTLSYKKIEDVLTLFVNTGFASERFFEGDPAPCYEPFRPRQHHDHFICVKCKEVFEFCNEQLESLQDSLFATKGWNPLFHKMEVYGVCKNCSADEQELVALAYVPEGREVAIAKIDSGYGLKKRLSSLGFLPHIPFK